MDRKVAKDNQLKCGDEMIWCPCMECQNYKRFDNINEIEFHLTTRGFKPRYTCWSMHGESLGDRDTSSNNLENDDKRNSINDTNGNLNDMFNNLETDAGDDELDKLKNIFDDSEKPLYTGCLKFSKLSAVLRLFNIKTKHGLSDTSFTDILEVVHEMLPEDNELPVSLYGAKKMMCPMGLKVKGIHACPNDCMLYRKKFKNDHKCFVCGVSRYKRKTETSEVDNDVKKNGPPAKLLWYLPIIPRLKQLFSNEKEAKLLRWHSDDRVNDRKLRHVADSPQWKNIDNMYPEFGNEGPKQPGNDIDVYLSPLIDDLKTMWGTGYNTKGYLACLVCENETSSKYLRKCKKVVYMRHRRFLPCDHIYRDKKKEFDGNSEHEVIRQRFDAFDQVKNINTVLGKRPRSEKTARGEKTTRGEKATIST
ncbi:uncharacterized protein LOC143570978 [Bidens hawaiensis]|uniref:uncharacterized protein LOC143570978 n=1 Tax=Bidens hawaiensis TaxID=980011 RepID=UPI00404996FE